MQQVDNLNQFAADVITRAAAIIQDQPIAAVAVVVVAADGRKMTNVASVNGYEMAGILQALAVTSSLSAQKAEAQAAAAAAEAPQIITN